MVALFSCSSVLMLATTFALFAWHSFWYSCFTRLRKLECESCWPCSCTRWALLGMTVRRRPGRLTSPLSVSSVSFFDAMSTHRRYRARLNTVHQILDPYPCLVLRLTLLFVALRPQAHVVLSCHAIVVTTIHLVVVPPP